MVPLGTVERTVIGGPDKGDVCAPIRLEQIEIDCQRSWVHRVHDKKRRRRDRRETHGSERAGDRPGFVQCTPSEAIERSLRAAGRDVPARRPPTEKIEVLRSRTQERRPVDVGDLPSWFALDERLLAQRLEDAGGVAAVDASSCRDFFEPVRRVRVDEHTYDPPRLRPPKAGGGRRRAVRVASRAFDLDVEVLQIETNIAGKVDVADLLGV